MALVAWAPQGISAPLELLAVKIQPGPVTRREWLEALADRVTQMATEEPEYLPQACKALGLQETDKPREAGQFLVLDNLELQTNLNLAVLDQYPFPATASNNPEAKQALEETNLQSWVESALSLVSESSLD